MLYPGHDLLYIYSVTPGSAVPPGGESSLIAGYIARWRPSSVSPRAAAFARDVIALTGPQGQERAKNLLWAAAKLADWALSLGLEAAPEVLLHPSTAERFTRCAPDLSGVARRTLRTNQRFIARRAVPQLYPSDAPLPRERAKKPYRPAEIGGFLALADAQPTAERRMRAAGEPLDHRRMEHNPGLEVQAQRRRVIREPARRPQQVLHPLPPLRPGLGDHVPGERRRPRRHRRRPPPPGIGGSLRIHTRVIL